MGSIITEVMESEKCCVTLQSSLVHCNFVIMLFGDIYVDNKIFYISEV